MDDNRLPPGVSHEIVEQIPLIWAEPTNPSASRKLVIWLPGFSGTKESVAPQLRDLADAGYVALSFDPWQHGERKVETRAQLVDRVLKNIRRHFWPILGQTAMEVPRVIDWAVERLKVSPRVRIGGISMGGDISIAAAGIDRRIEVVAATIATPDWLRPGSNEPPGQADAYAQGFYNRQNPLTNLDLFTHRPAISFQCGELDRQVPPDGAVRFRTALASHYANCPHRLDVTLHAGRAHEFAPAMWQNCLRWFAAGA